MTAVRRLAAILSADVVGYSRLMGLDEVGTAHALRDHRAAADPLIAEHGGRVVKTTGDGVLIEFGSVVGAVECALGLQRLAAQRNTETPADRRMEWRIGIHIGDVLIEGEDILGDGVNIAARLEGIAEPGGICISEDAFRQVRGKVEAEFADLGEQSLKNIARPLRVYHLDPAAGATAAVTPPPAVPLPDKPSIAVLSFQNMTGDAEQEYFVDGMVEEITTAIARLPWLFVIARNSAFTYKGKPIDLKEVARELGVRYVLEGSVRKAGNRVRITGQLIDTTTGAHIWADRFDSALDDIFELQDRVASSVVGAIEPKLRQSEIERASRKPTGNLTAYDLYLRALAHYYRYTEKDNAEAVALLRQASAIDPLYGPPAALIGWCYLIQRIQGWGTVSDDDVAAALRLARQALEVARDDPDTMVAAAFTLFYGGGETALAESVLDRALTLNPNSALGWMVRGFVHAVGRNQPGPAIESLERALRLSPFDPLGFINATWLAQAHLAARRFEQAIEWADTALHKQPRNIVAIRPKIIALAYLGRLDEARAELGRMLALYPGLTIAAFRPTTASFDPEFIEFALAGLRLAGLPEG